MVFQDLNQSNPSNTFSSEQVQSLVEISSLLNSIHDLATLLPKIMDVALAPVQAERGLLVIKENDDFRVAVARSIHNDEEDLVDYSRSIVRRAMTDNVAILTHDAQTDPRFSDAQSVIIKQITSVICVPLVVKDHVEGAIYLDAKQNRTQFTNESLDFLKILANISAIAIQNARYFEGLALEKVRLQSEVERTYAFSEIIGNHPKMIEIFKLLEKIKDSNISVLIEGESGTGKELVARALHYSSTRRSKPFIAQYCGNLSENLLESELFGHKRGSFTGAHQDKKGLLEIADGGTFFLDEIADISPTIQAKLLRVLQDGVIRRVGDTLERKVDVRIVSATNRSLKKEVEKGSFREDLYYRLNVVTITLPPLRERKSDIPLLVHHFLKKNAQRHGDPTPKRISPEALRQLQSYHWPGNIRELENTIERAYVLSSTSQIEPEDLISPHFETDPDQTLRHITKQHVLKVLKDCEGNKKKAAELLDVSLRWLHYKLNEWHIESD
ncbi:MAG: sigma 54-interacting transcriptional regulator [bacterium]|nr:sigma 54-interacting transcriptional regulator [bacterium]